jgi:hypothetical protein
VRRGAIGLRRVEVQDLIAAKCLEVWGLNGELSCDRPNLRRDWVIATVIWHERRETNAQFKSATERAESLSDITHAAGNLMVGSFLAWTIALILAFVHQELSCLTLRGGLGLLLVAVHVWAFFKIGRLTRTFIGTIIRNQVRYDCGKDGKPIRVYYAGE